MDIIDKLRLEKWSDRLLLGCPEWEEAFGRLSFDTEPKAKCYGAMVLFVFSLEEMKLYAEQVISGALRLEEGGLLYFVYPKKGNKRYDNYIGRDDIFPALGRDEEGYIPGSKLRFNKMLSLDETFTIIGLKWETSVRRKASESPSQRVADYEGREAELEALLGRNPEALAFYQQLSPGYRRGWARYVFGVKREETMKRRLEETVRLLAMGVKSKELYKGE